jgi:hypothetical protein
MQIARSLRLTAVSLLASAGSLSAQQIVYGSGTTFTNAGPSNAADPSCAAAANTWCARNVRNNGQAGITTDYARNGNGSIYFRAPQSGANSSKADMEIFFGSGFSLSQLESMSYDWYRNAASTNNPLQVPSLRLILGNSSSPLSFNSYLIYEPYYDGGAGWTAPTNAWQTSTIGSTGLFWRSGQAFESKSLADWQTQLSSLFVIGLSTGVGSGWNGDFIGAVDNISYTTAGTAAVSFNFETAVVPEPSTYALLGSGLLALGGIAARRRRSA